MSYPNYPNNRLIVGGVDLTTRFRLILVDGYTLNPPEPKTYTVDIPGGDGVIDLTESLTGDVVYNNRTQTFQFALMNMKGVDDTSIQEFERAKTDVMNFLHGRAFDYQMTMDPGYTYHGRFTVSTHTQSMYANGRLGVIEVNIDADPYKLKEKCIYKLNGAGGKLFRLESGRKPVHPVIETSSPIRVTWNGNESTVPSGSYRLNNVLFTDGFNELYINSFQMLDTLWSELDENGSNAMTWIEASQYRWDELARINLNPNDVPQSWEDLSMTTWESVADKKWSDLDWRPTNGDTVGPDVYVSYDWSDL